MPSWKTQSLTMKRIWVVLALVTVVILVHGTYTFRKNHQVAFAQGVEQKIAIESIHVKANSGTLVLFGRGSKQQSEYAESVARSCIRKYASRTINPPKDVRNEIETGNVVTRATPRDGKAAHSGASGRSIASVRKPARASK